MNPGLLQRFVDHARATSVSCWGLRIGAVSVVVCASVVTGAASGNNGYWIVIFVGGASIGAVGQPNSHWGLVAVSLVAAQWLVVVDDVSTAWATVVAVLLFGFHVVVALLASIPHTARVPREVQMEWIRRSSVVVAVTIAMWAVVFALSHRDASGSVALSFLSLAGLCALTIAARARTFSSTD